MVNYANYFLPTEDFLNSDAFQCKRSVIAAIHFSVNPTKLDLGVCQRSHQVNYTIRSLLDTNTEIK